MVTWSSRRRRRAMCLLLVRLLLAATSWGLGAGDIASTLPGGETHFSCSAKGPGVTWEWEPLYPKCAGVKSTWTLIYSIDRNGAHRVESDRFKGRLTVTAGPQSGEFTLVLKDAVMSDSGLYSCSDSTGPVGDRLNLTVTAGDVVSLEDRSGLARVRPRLYFATETKNARKPLSASGSSLVVSRPRSAGSWPLAEGASSRFLLVSVYRERGLMASRAADRSAPFPSGGGCHRGFRVTPASQNVTPKLGEAFSFYCTACDGTELPSDSFDWIVSGRPISTNSSGYLLGRKALSVLAVDERIEGGVSCGVGGQRSELCPRVDRPSGQDSPSAVSTATLQPTKQIAVWTETPGTGTESNSSRLSLLYTGVKLCALTAMVSAVVVTEVKARRRGAGSGA